MHKSDNSSNLFAGFYIYRTRGVTTRKPFSMSDLRLLQNKCKSAPEMGIKNDCFVVNDTGLRSSEALGLNIMICI